MLLVALMKHLSSLHWLFMMWYDVTVREGVDEGVMEQTREWLYMNWYDEVDREVVERGSMGRGWKESRLE